MAVRYNRMNPLYWQRAKEWDERTRNLGCFLYTCRHRTGEGLYTLPIAYAASDLKWTTAVAQKAMDTLVLAGEIHYDDTSGVVLLPDALEIQAPTSPTQITGAIARIRTVPLSPLLSKLYQLAVTHANGLAEAMAKELHDELELAMRMETTFHSHTHSNGVREQV